MLLALGDQLGLAGDVFLVMLRLFGRHELHLDATRLLGAPEHLVVPQGCFDVGATQELNDRRIFGKAHVWRPAWLLMSFLQRLMPVLLAQDEAAGLPGAVRTLPLLSVDLTVALRIDFRETELELLLALLALLIDGFAHLGRHSELLAGARRRNTAEGVIVVVGHFARDELVLLDLFPQVQQLPLLHPVPILSQFFDGLVVLLVIGVLRRDVHARDGAELIQNDLLLLP